MRKIHVIIAVILITSLIVFTSCQQTAVTSAKVYMQQQNYDMAIEQAKVGIENVPNDPEAHYILGQAYGFKRMYRDMNEAYTNSLKNGSKFEKEIEQDRLKYWIDLFNGGVGLIKQNDTKGAIEKFEVATEILPDRVDGHKNLAYAYTQDNNDAAAQETYLKAIEIAPEDMELKNFLGLLHYKNKEYGKAVELLEVVVAKSEPTSKEYQEALYNLAYSYDLMDQPDKAIAAYDNALKVSPNDKDLIFNMGRLYFMQERYDDAINMFERVIKTDPEDGDSYQNIGQAYLGQEKFEEAIPYFEKSVEIKPDNMSAWTNLGVCYVRTGNMEKGQAAFAKADELKK